MTLEGVFSGVKNNSKNFGNKHIGALWTEGLFEKFQFYVLPMKNLFFFPEILLDNSLTFKMTYWICM